jgi:hypothetical protein
VAAILAEANGLKDQVDALVKEAGKIARKNDLVFEQRFRDALPEVLDPSLYEEIEEEVEVYDYKLKKNRKVIEKSKVFKADLPIAFTRECYVEPGDSVDAWIPSSLC